MLTSFQKRLRKLGFGFGLTPIPEEQIRALAERLALQRPSRSAEENWFAAQKAINRAPLGPWIIKFSGEKERSGWDWAELSLRVSVPLLILLVSVTYGRVNERRQEAVERDKREAAIVAGFIKEMNSLIHTSRIEQGVGSSGIESRHILIPMRETLLHALSQLKAPDSYATEVKRAQVLRYVQSAGLASGKRSLLAGARLNDLNLDGAWLRGANLYDASLFETQLNRAILMCADLREANMQGAYLVGTNLARADLRNTFLGSATLTGANLEGADLRGTIFFFAQKGKSGSSAYLGGANLQGVVWDEKTQWPKTEHFNGAVNIPADLRKELGLAPSNVREDQHRVGFWTPDSCEDYTAN